jgi:hypothetical protein
MNRHQHSQIQFPLLLWLGFYKMWAADKVYPGFKSVASICYGLGECEQRTARSELLKMVLGHWRRM